MIKNDLISNTSKIIIVPTKGSTIKRYLKNNKYHYLPLVNGRITTNNYN